MIKTENTAKKTADRRLVENPKVSAPNGKCCKYCNKPIQYFTDDRQEYCSNTCRSMTNQAKKAAKTEIAALKRETTEIASGFGSNQAIKSGQGMNSEQLWNLVEAMMTELASEKAKNATLSKELGRFKKVAFNLYVSE
ncbi:MAG: hypothetical protein EAZ08_02035 [Cytophagales bacterium]|nr:MAG: hypothetical protein EAZ08_02035 [Cytophagales bacterium]